MFLLASSIMNNIVVLPSRSRFPVKLTCSIAFGLASSACYLLRLQSLCSNYYINYNLIDNQMRNHFLDQLRYFECDHMLLNYFLLVDQKSFVHKSQHYISLFLLAENEVPIKS